MARINTLPRFRKSVFGVAALAAFAVEAAAAGACPAPATWTKPADHRAVAYPALLAEASRQNVVLLGERHDNPDHHRWQLQVVSGLYALRGDLALGFEMFPRDVQPVLDAWVAGQLTEKELLEQTRWDDTWRFDPKLYLPLFHFARLNHIPMLALNVNESLLAAVREQGWDAVPLSQRQGITDPAPAQRDYLEMLAASFMHHVPAGDRSGHGMNKEQQLRAFQRFVEGQLLWDRAMALTLAEAGARKHAPLLVGIMGSGHISNGFGVPHQLADLGVTKVMTLLPFDGQVSCDDLTPGFASAVFALEPRPAAPAADRPRLGVFLNGSRDGGAQVVELAPDSVAAASGLQSGDWIVAVAGRHVAGVGDVIRAVKQVTPGTWLPMTVRRGEQQLDLVAKFPP
ncbi:MAG TPA: PDZ domain-containing protein [Gammaproteobacteria bacterium]|nr:PDZ domain-containing protein [Gammaproteobacteria bacterium]